METLSFAELKSGTGEAERLTIFIGDIRVLYMVITSVNLSLPPGAGFT